ncbi:dTDP-4-dehydrorhamnose 3,5-epimerase [Crocosphaera sp. XPORK-15E]|uniref:dTDP-4-dehydrorhamnose 3,5-epimerase n=1 Tax=Crocosphaera sp. XPORK-15E TaxID=3110247 RepID=UPI002B1F20CB|nr:dTDP-4-dehydrorhamnose 3,5-epimerase [Crocosphaera sp. XPORK-15E]MEA5532659.1 dTDP-4-dehydrorhamnose 3,5-epimerase [Crocosphaera sp. XPORK-15E]
MSLIDGVSVRKLESIQGGMAQFYTPQSSNETMLVQIPKGTIDELFVHRFQTDQLLVVRGSFILVALHNKQYHYIPLSEHKPQVITIPPGVPHGAINLSSKDCLLVNAVLRHGKAHPFDYRPMKLPFPYDFNKINDVLEDLSKLGFEEEKEAVLF